MTYGDDVIAVGPTTALERLRAVIDLAPAALVAVDLVGRVTLWNPAAERLFGWPAGDVLGRPDPTLGGALPDVAPGTRVHRDGSALPVEVASSPLHDDGGAVAGRLSVYAEAGERRRHESDLAARARQQAGIVEIGEVALSGTPMDVVTARAAAIVARTLDLPAVTLLRAVPAAGGLRDGVTLVTAAVHAHGLSCPAPPWVVGEPAGRGLGPAARAMSGRCAVVADVADLPEHERAGLAAEGLARVACVVVGKPTDPWGVLLATSRRPGVLRPDDVWFLQAVAGVVAAADARRTAEAEVRHRATHDALTGLPNREMVVERLHDELAEGRRRRLASALLVLDLDGFKDVNDSHGHQAGDHVLRQVADRVRAAIGTRGLVARLGGDEFAVLLGGLASPLDASVVAAELLTVLDAPFGTPGGPVRIGGSVGIALAPSQGDDAQTLLMRADLAMYRAKREHLGHTLFDSRWDRDASARLALVTELHDAIADGDVRVEYQPLVALRSHRVWGAEALARWTSPRLGPQSPADFVALAEQCGLIDDLTALVLRSAARQAARWRDAGLRLAVSVNVSPVSLAGPRFARLVDACMTEHALTPEHLQLEVTESSLADGAAAMALNRLAADGIRVALDDFGTGYSSLARLKHLPVRALKVDRSFVLGVAEDPRDLAILRTVMTLATELDLLVAAEGVETPQAAQVVTDLGVHLAQGLLYAPAMAPAQFEDWHGRWSAGAWTCCAPALTSSGVSCR
jgi:diguanylate cyclase (GGDEF)-like protein